jgi:hypothetical protein
MRNTEKYHTTKEKISRRINRKDQNKKQFDEDGEVIEWSDKYFEQPSDEDPQENFLTMRQLNINGMENTNLTPNNQDTNPETEEQEQETPPPPPP